MLTVQCAHVVRVKDQAMWQLEDGSTVSTLTINAPLAGDEKRAAVAMMSAPECDEPPRLHLLATSDRDGLWRPVASPLEPAGTIWLYAWCFCCGSTLVIATREAVDGPVPALLPLHHWPSAEQVVS
jgi:hypothetical protein